MEQSWLIDAQPVTDWLKTLEPPTGLFVCNDIRGQQLLNACRALEVSVPDDIGVIGVDDDDTICSLSDPPLSSVESDTEQVGYVAASLLDEMIEETANGGPIETQILPVMEALAADVGRQLTWKRIPFETLLPSAQAGLVDVVCATVGHHRRQLVLVDANGTSLEDISLTIRAPLHKHIQLVLSSEQSARSLHDFFESETCEYQ